MSPGSVARPTRIYHNCAGRYLGLNPHSIDHPVSCRFSPIARRLPFSLPYPTLKAALIKVYASARFSCSTSWLNLVERLLALLTEKQLRRGVHRSTRELEDAIRAYLEHHNRDPKPFIWTKTADQILESVARFCTRISDSGH
jgi:hypothetical protein